MGELEGKLGVLLSAISLDANSSIFPITIVFVKVKTWTV